MNSSYPRNAYGKQLLVLLISLTTLSFTVKVQNRELADAACSTVGKVRQIEQDTRWLVEYSQGLYRFYKLTSEKPTARTKTAN